MNALTEFMHTDLLSMDTSLQESLRPLLDAIRLRHPNAEALILYGSCRRQAIEADSLVDLLLLVSQYRDGSSSRLSAVANRILPPNVHYLETDGQADGKTPLRSKYAIITLADFARKVRSGLDSYFWARFTQPAQLLWHRHPDVIAQLAHCRAEAALGFWRRGLALCPSGEDTVSAADAFWMRALSASYQRELRPEPSTHTATLVAADASYWQALTEVLQIIAPSQQQSAGGARWGWRLRRITGPSLNLLRLLKAASTFSDGVDYLSWKIQRHTGQKVTVSPFMRRHPRLAAAPLAWQLWRQRSAR